MRAARLHGHKDLRIEEVPEPICKAGHVKVQPRFNGICGSDLHAYFVKDFPQIFGPDPHPLTGAKPPVIFGHEFSGVVTETGAGVHSVAAGDLVAVMPIISDGTCDACRLGAINCCQRLGFIGFHGLGGGLSGAIVLAEDRVFKLPDTIDPELGALVEPLAVGWRAVRMVHDVVPETTALVIGGGPVGCAVVLSLVGRGVKNIIVSEISPARERIVREIGASHVLNPAETSVLDFVMEHTGGRGADAVFDCAGNPVTVKLACRAVRAQCQIINLALFPGDVSLDAGVLHMKEASWRPSLAYTVQDFHEVIGALASGSMNPRSMITKRIALDRVVEDGLNVLHDAGGEHCKVLVDLSL